MFIFLEHITSRWRFTPILNICWVPCFFFLVHSKIIYIILYILCFFFNFNWRLITLQYCGGFCNTCTPMADSCECLVFEKDSLTAARDPSLSARFGGRGAVRCLKGSSKRWMETVSQSFWGLAVDSLASALIKLCQCFGRKKKYTYSKANQQTTSL